MRRGLEREGGEIAFARDVHDAHRRAPHVHRVRGDERAHDERHEVGGHGDGVAEPDPPSALGQRGVVDLGAVGIGRQPVGDVEGDREHRLAVGLVETRKGTPGVGGLELRGGDGVGDAFVVGEGRAVKAMQLVVEDARELEGDHPRARGQ